MIGMPPKKDLPPRLSDYLLEKAAPFEFYPKRLYGLTPEVRKIFGDLSRDLVEWRKTFQPKGDSRRLDFHAQPVMLDQFYSKELLSAVPGFVERTRDLRELTFAGLTDAASLSYLREAATCYIHGLFQATVALARAAMERRLRERIRVLAGQQVAGELDLKQLLDRYGERLLGKQSANAAHVVRLTGNQVLHERAIGSEKALAVLEAARSVILELN
jgi:hypothetical protein